MPNKLKHTCYPSGSALTIPVQISFSHRNVNTDNIHVTFLLIMTAFFFRITIFTKVSITKQDNCNIIL